MSRCIGGIKDLLAPYTLILIQKILKFDFFSLLLYNCTRKRLKMKITPFGIFIASAVAISIYQLSRLRSLKTATFKINQFSIKNASNILVQVQVINKNSFDVSLNAIDLDMFFYGKKIGTVEFLDNVLLPANQATIINLKVSIDPLTGVTLISDISRKKFKKQSGEIDFKGKLVADGISLPVETSYKLW